MSPDGFEIHWRTNYLGTIHLTHGLLPLLLGTARNLGESRVVNVVSQLHSRGSNDLLFDETRPYESWQAYGLSKLELVHFTRELHRRYHTAEGLGSYSVHPGGRSGAYTNVAGKGLSGHPIIETLRRWAAPLEQLILASAAEGAQTQIYCATSAAAQSGCYYFNGHVADSSADSMDKNAARRLWEETRAWLESVYTAGLEQTS